MLFKKLFLSLILALTIINPVAAYAISLIPGGDSIGIELDYQGVVITGGYAIEIDNKKYNVTIDRLNKKHLAFLSETLSAEKHTIIITVKRGTLNLESIIIK